MNGVRFCSCRVLLVFAILFTILTPENLLFFIKNVFFCPFFAQLKKNFFNQFELLSKKIYICTWRTSASWRKRSAGVPQCDKKEY